MSQFVIPHQEPTIQTVQQMEVPQSQYLDPLIDVVW